MANEYRCKFCEFKCFTKKLMWDHINKNHQEDIMVLSIIDFTEKKEQEKEE